MASPRGDGDARVYSLAPLGMGFATSRRYKHLFHTLGRAIPLPVLTLVYFFRLVLIHMKKAASESSLGKNKPLCLNEAVTCFFILYLFKTKHTIIKLSKTLLYCSPNAGKRRFIRLI